LRVTLRGTASLDATARTIVGVVTDLKEETIYRPAPPTVYVPIGQAPTIRLAFLLRTVRGGVDGRREVIRDGARLLATGIAFGLVGAIWGANVLRSMVYASIAPARQRSSWRPRSSRSRCCRGVTFRRAGVAARPGARAVDGVVTLAEGFA
jgi:hypothetical protein